MREIEIEEPNGYFIDADGRICGRFGQYRIGIHQVPDHVADIEYVDGPTAHDEEVHEDYLAEQF